MESTQTIDYDTPQEDARHIIRHISVPNAPDFYSIIVSGIEYRNTAYMGRAE